MKYEHCNFQFEGYPGQDCQSQQYLRALYTQGQRQAEGFEALRNIAMQQYQPPSKLDRARERFGRPFKDWKPRAKPVLTEWMETRGAK